MLKLKEKSCRMPYGGHHYPDCGVTFKGDSFQEVVDKLRDFRLRNNIEVGEPDQDVLCFYAIHWPWLVSVDRKRPDTPKENVQFAAWREWIQNAWKNPPAKFVTTKEAKDRWAICSTCPFNRPWDFSETKESAELTRRAYLLRKGIDVPSDLQFCDLHRADIGAFSFISSAKDYSAKNSEEHYDGCWVYENTQGTGSV
jgi:hypothetical protein